MLFAVAAVFAAMGAAPPANCQFRAVDSHWEGSCALSGRTPSFSVSRAKAITTGVWRKDVEPASVWAGNMTDPGNPSSPVEIEVYSDGTGVLRSEYGWFPVSAFTLAPPTLQFQVDGSREVPPSELDRQIVRRARATLSSSSAWNRADTRQCSPSEKKLSIYCALQRATVDVTGAFHHRRPAMQVVRQVVEERTAGRDYQHRLMDYNNDSSTTLADVRSVFDESLARLDKVAR